MKRKDSTHKSSSIYRVIGIVFKRLLLAFFLGLAFGNLHKTVRQWKSVPLSTTVTSRESLRVSTAEHQKEVETPTRGEKKVEVQRAKDPSSATALLSPAIRSTSKAKWKEDCDPQTRGLIVSNQVGLMGNNFFEIGMANRLAKELCWDVVYRPFWNHFFPSEDSLRCFPNSMLPNDIPYNIDLMEELRITDSVWDDLNWNETKESENNSNHESSQRLATWYKSNFTADQVWECIHPDCDFTGDNIPQLVQSIQNGTSSYKILWLEAFFIHYDWIDQGSSSWLPQMRQWLKPHESCCPHTPPDNAVVLHVRDFEPEDDDKNRNVTYSMYVDVLKHYNLVDPHRPVWIVCQPKTVDKPIVQDLKAKLPNPVEVYLGNDHIDAWCILSRAKKLIVDTSSSYSQSAALLGTPLRVHYPTHTLDVPPVTLKVPEWKYHWVDQTHVKEFNVDQDRLTVELA